MSEMQHFPNFSYVGANFRIELSLDKYSSRFTEAQQWLGDRVLEDSKLDCFTSTEQDIIQKLESVPNRAGYIKSLIRADIAASKKED